VLLLLLLLCEEVVLDWIVKVDLNLKRCQSRSKFYFISSKVCLIYARDFFFSSILFFYFFCALRVFRSGYTSVNGLKFFRFIFKCPKNLWLRRLDIKSQPQIYSFTVAIYPFVCWLYNHDFIHCCPHPSPPTSYSPVAGPFSDSGQFTLRHLLLLYASRLFFFLLFFIRYLFFSS
jgi:hypothetical protein